MQPRTAERAVDPPTRAAVIRSAAGVCLTGWLMTAPLVGIAVLAAAFLDVLGGYLNAFVNGSEDPAGRHVDAVNRALLPGLPIGLSVSGALLVIAAVFPRRPYRSTRVMGVASALGGIACTAAITVVTLR